MNSDPAQSPSAAKVIFYLGAPVPSRTRMALAKLPVSPRTIVYTNSTRAAEFRSRYYKSFCMPQYQDQQTDKYGGVKVSPLFGPADPRILSIMDGPNALLAERIWDHVFFENLPTTPFDATRSLQLALLLARLALGRCGTIVSGISVKSEKEALIFEHLLHRAGVLGRDVVSFWLNSETNSAIRYLRIPAQALVNQPMDTQMSPRDAFAPLFNLKTLATERGTH